MLSDSTDLAPHVPPPEAMELVSIVEELTARAEERLVITNETEAMHATNLLKAINTRIKESEAARKRLTGPYVEKKKNLDADFKKISDPLGAAKKKVNAAVSAYVRAREEEVERRRLEADRLAAEEQKRLETEAAKRAETERTAAILEGREDEPVKPPEPVPEVRPAYVAPAQRVETAHAAVVSRKTWTFEVTDKMALIQEVAAGRAPWALDWLEVNGTAVRVSMKQAKDQGEPPNTPQVPGVRIYQEHGTHVR